MLEIGTKVFINYVFRQHRPRPTGHEMNLERRYGTVKSLNDDDYYEISVVDKVTGETLSGCFHRYELSTSDIVNQSIASVIWYAFAI